MFGFLSTEFGFYRDRSFIPRSINLFSSFFEKCNLSLEHKTKCATLCHALCNTVGVWRSHQEQEWTECPVHSPAGTSRPRAVCNVSDDGRWPAFQHWRCRQAILHPVVQQTNFIPYCFGQIWRRVRPQQCWCVVVNIFSNSICVPLRHSTIAFKNYKWCPRCDFTMAFKELMSGYVITGTEPSGRAFNEMALKDAPTEGNPGRQIPHNPCINAGAIMAVSMVRDPKLFEKWIADWYTIYGWYIEVRVGFFRCLSVARKSIFVDSWMHGFSFARFCSREVQVGVRIRSCDQWKHSRKYQFFNTCLWTTWYARCIPNSQEKNDIRRYEGLHDTSMIRCERLCWHCRFGRSSHQICAWNDHWMESAWGEKHA